MQINKFGTAILILKPNVEATWSDEISTEEDFKKVKWVTGVAENGIAITSDTCPHSEITWTKVKTEMDKL